MELSMIINWNDNILIMVMMMMIIKCSRKIIVNIGREEWYWQWSILFNNENDH